MQGIKELAIEARGAEEFYSSNFQENKQYQDGNDQRVPWQASFRHRI